MSDENMNKIQEALKFFGMDNVPSMKELNSRYRKLALLKHPDKNSGSKEATEDYQNLLMYYKIIGDFIVENNVKDNDVSEEEQDNVNIFENFNFDQRNKGSHTIFVEKDMVNNWKRILTEKFGIHENKGKQNGLIFKANEFEVNEEMFSITITLWENPKDDKPKLLIQNPKQFASDIFVTRELPELYSEVRKLSGAAAVGADGAGAGASGDTDGTSRNGRNLRKRPPRQSVKAIKRNSFLNYFKCRFKACKFASPVAKEVNVHTKTAHPNPFDKQRDLAVDKTVSESMEDTVTDDIVEEAVEDDSVDTDSTSLIENIENETELTSETQLKQAQVKIVEYQEKNIKLQSGLDEKEIKIGQLEDKISELEREKRALAKQIASMESDKTKLKKELETAIDKASNLCEENTILKEKVDTLNNIEEADTVIQKKYEAIIKKKKTAQSSQTDDAENEDENIVALVQYKNTGFRQTSPAAPAEGASGGIQKSLKCGHCDFKATNENSLKNHVGHCHYKCDICSRVLGTVTQLRSHIRDIHDKQNGTMMECRTCKFSSLSKKHLEIHIRRHHRDLSCKECDYKTKSLNLLKEHSAQAHKHRNTVCKYWLQNRCRRTSCQFLHEQRNCKFGLNCKRSNCRFIHPKAVDTVQNKPRVNPWINPAFLSENTYNGEFPFLGKTCRCQRSQGV